MMYQMYDVQVYNVAMVNLACLLYFTSILHGAKCQQITAKS